MFPISRGHERQHGQASESMGPVQSDVFAFSNMRVDGFENVGLVSRALREPDQHRDDLRAKSLAQQVADRV